MAHDLSTLSGHIAGELPTQPGYDIQGLGMPPAQRVDSNGNKLQALRLALLSVLPGLEVMGVLNHVCPVHGAPSDQGRVECVGAGEVQTGVLAIRPGAQEDVHGPVL